MNERRTTGHMNSTNDKDKLQDSKDNLPKKIEELSEEDLDQQHFDMSEVPIWYEHG